jgi:hypothetical protein
MYLWIIVEDRVNVTPSQTSVPGIYACLDLLNVFKPVTYL